MGKWTYLKEQHGRPPEQDLARWQQIEEKVNTIYAKDTLPNLTDGYVYLRKRKADLEKELELVQFDLDCNEKAIVDKFEDAGMTSLKLETGVTLSLRDTPYFKVEDEERFYAWIERNGLEKEFPRKVLSQTVTGKTKQLLDEGKELPEGVTITGVRTQLSALGLKEKQ